MVPYFFDNNLWWQTKPEKKRRPVSVVGWSDSLTCHHRWTNSPNGGSGGILSTPTCSAVGFFGRLGTIYVIYLPATCHRQTNICLFVSLQRISKINFQNTIETVWNVIEHAHSPNPTFSAPFFRKREGLALYSTHFATSHLTKLIDFEIHSADCTRFF